MTDSISVAVPDEGEFMDRIVEEAARQMLRRFTEDPEDGSTLQVPTELHRKLETTITETIREEARAAAPKVAAQILEEGVQRTGTYGENRGEPVPVRQIVADEVRKTLSDGQTGRRGEGVLEELIRRTVKREVKEELQGALDEAKKKVAEAVNSEAANLVQDAMERALRKIEVSA